MQWLAAAVVETEMEIPPLVLANPTPKMRKSFLTKCVQNRHQNIDVDILLLVRVTQMRNIMRKVRRTLGFLWMTMRDRLLVSVIRITTSHLPNQLTKFLPLQKKEALNLMIRLVNPRRQKQNKFHLSQLPFPLVQPEMENRKWHTPRHHKNLLRFQCHQWNKQKR